MRNGMYLRIAAVWSAVVACGVLSGCGGDGEKRVVDLEKRVASLEGRLAMMERHQVFAQGMRIPQRRVEGRDSGDVTRRKPLSPEQIAERQRLRDEVRKRLEERRDNARAKKQGGEGAEMSAKEQTGK